MHVVIAAGTGLIRRTQRSAFTFIKKVGSVELPTIQDLPGKGLKQAVQPNTQPDEEIAVDSRNQE